MSTIQNLDDRWFLVTEAYYRAVANGNRRLAGEFARLMDQGDEAAMELAIGLIQGTESAKHLPGQHDQESHGRRGEGSEEGGGREGGAGGAGRSSDYRGQVNSLHERAKVLDKEITPAFTNAVEGSGGQTVGLDFRIKASLDRAEQKLREKAAESGTGAENPEQHLHDMLRYTATWTSDRYVEGRDRFIAEMKAKGFEIYDHKDKNYWNGEFYRGDNYVFEHRSGFTFEVQMHTPDSYRAKEGQHRIYEEFRADGTSAERRKQLAEEMRGFWSSVVIPAGALGLGNVVSP
jgi:hypothetical protein